MTKVFTKTTTGSELVAGVVGTVDVGATIARAIDLKVDIDRAEDQYRTVRSWVDMQRDIYVKLWEEWSSKPFSTVKDSLLGVYLANLKDTSEMLKAQAIQGAGGYSATATMMGLRLKYLTSFVGQSSLTEAFLGIPQSIFETKAERYWNQKLAPNVPDMKTAFKLMMEGQISRAEFNAYCGYEGWGSGWHDKLYAMLDTDPNIYQAFEMWKRKLITEAKMNECFKMAGWDEKYHSVLKQFLHRLPTFMELMRLADYVPLETLWVTQVLEANGYENAVAARVAKAIELRPLREEVRSVAGRYCWQYQIGRISRDAFKRNLEKLGLLPKEVTFWVLWGDLRYADELKDEQIDIIEQRVIKGNITTKEDIKTELITLGILEEKANLMAELWYWKYLVE